MNGPATMTTPSGRTVLILHTGGTIGMEPSPDGYRPMAGFDSVLRDALAACAGPALPSVDVIALPNPIDSANLHPALWASMADTLLRHWSDYDGFVVLHGTDTLAWSASALSFLLRGADKPVILTGAQIPMMMPRSDALANAEAAVLLAASPALHEVGLFFGTRLLRGNRSTKAATTAFAAFDSPNAPPLAEAGIDLTIYPDRLLPAPAAPFAPDTCPSPSFDPEAVAVLTLHPGVSARMVDGLIGDGRTKGLILRSYGVGNAPDADLALMQALKRAVDRGTTVVNTTQCRHGQVVQGAYATGSALSRIGVLPGADLTLEAAFAKLHVLLASGKTGEDLRQTLRTPLCGEMDNT